MRKAFALAVVAFATAAAVSAGLTPAASGDKKATINIGVFLASSANTYWAAELEGAKAVAKKYPNVKLTVFDAKFTTNTQVNQLRNALVSKKYQAWFIGPNNGGHVDAHDQAGGRSGRQGRLLARTVRAGHPRREGANPRPGDLRRARLLP